MNMEPLTDYGELMTLEAFEASVNCGAFIDYDGFGVYAMSDKQSDVKVTPSSFKQKGPDLNFTHVMWYNR